jgi:hypothetical protein
LKGYGEITSKLSGRLTTKSSFSVGELGCELLGPEKEVIGDA